MLKPLTVKTPKALSRFALPGIIQVLELFKTGHSSKISYFERGRGGVTTFHRLNKLTLVFVLWLRLS